MEQNPLQMTNDEHTGAISSIKLYDVELLQQGAEDVAELMINGLPLRTRLQQAPTGSAYGTTRVKGEKFIDHFSGAGLVVVRSMGPRDYQKHPCVGIHYLIRRELADMDDLPCPGPGGPVIEAPLYVDTFSLLNLPWNFWGEDTRMIFPSAHSSGPIDEFGHVGYEHDTPENCKKYLQNVWRRIYPGVMGIHGGVFYDVKTSNWIAITCRRPHVGYILNITNAGRGVGYDFTLHAPFNIGDSLQMPEIKIYYGQTHDEMMTFMADYVTHYICEPPAWVSKTLWGEGLAWTNKPTWKEQADYWEERLATGEVTGIGYSLVTNRPIFSGTTPLGYEPDPNHGTKDEFARMCRRITDKGVPMLIWMSHSGLLPQGGEDIEDDWFVRGIDGRACASWGSIDGGMSHINPGHPGYIEYTKKWIRFYMLECGVKGFFFDCLGWAFPPDFTPRSFMRYPGDTNRMTIKFLEEIHACVKECDPEGIIFGEGTTFDGPVDLATININPVRGIDGWGPRDFFLQLNQYSDKQIILDQGPRFSAAAGFVAMLVDGPGAAAKNRYMAKLLREHGGPRTFTQLPGDLSILASQRLLVVPAPEGLSHFPSFRLPKPWDKVTTLIEETDQTTVHATADGSFGEMYPGIYRMIEK